MKQTLQFFTAMAFAASMCVAAAQVAAAQTAPSDVIIYTNPERPRRPAKLQTLHALLIGYDENRGDSTVSPYVVVRRLDDNTLVKIFLSSETKIDGVPFWCPQIPGTTRGICARLPSSLALKLPAVVDIVVWQDGLLFQPEPVLGTDTINVMALPTQQP